MISIGGAIVMMIIAGVVALGYAFFNIFQLKKFVQKRKSQNYSLFMNETETGEKVDSVETNIESVNEVIIQIMKGIQSILR